MQVSAHKDTFARDNLPPSEQWPELLLDGPDTAYPARLNCAVELVDAMVRQGQGGRVALRWYQDGAPAAMSYAELQALSNRIGRVLQEDMKLVPGNRIVLRGPNNPMMAAAWLGAIKAGMVTVPTMPLLRAKELKQIIDKAEVQAMLCDVRLKDEALECQNPDSEYYCPKLEQIVLFNEDAPGSLDSLAAAKPDHFLACDTAADDVCLIAFTSGTTGAPKGCMHFHRDVLAMCDLFPRHVIKPGPDDVFCGTPPLAFTFGLGGLLCFPLRVGASTVLAEKLSPESLLQLIEDFQATIVFTAPTFYRQMAPLVEKFRLGSLKKSVSAGEALPDATRQLWKQATGIEMIDGIGGTEMIHVFVSSAPESVRRGAIGQVVPGYVAQVVDDDMKPVPNGTPGRLAVKGPTGCRYLADPRQERFVQQGWNLPGDTFVQDDDGYLYYQARNDDMIISAGYNIAGPEVEDAMLRHEAVAECGVVAMPDDERGQVVAAYVVLKPGFDGTPQLARALQNYVKESIAPYKYPRVVRFVAVLPRTETGKLQRFVLRQLATGGR
ncbi:AMP-binding protein [Bordetella avium]|uniref:AMP-binding protein n=1 Tax=Bordetella avium TaxID=521 RepID=UPI000E0CA5CA|nr:AMP-binding protein [Bordetella avium]RIQ15468.1 2-aminobenzoate-CoA ligase [Bordetella avium]RIQ38420.1 2-aminobenzoate-CoA ligase [Bordetella avium]RIQ42961.1 2-aminobenzoate-CoA ligase [Bordetella avium]RIQ44108.1 2-aminobenzoate-CoA ligase [Bordetella avium]RIQ52978.1 2-aminobenzoate-CoA ligase [Bordetella avium]